MYIRRSKRRISVWGLVFAVLLTVIMQTLMIPCSANIIDGVRNAGEEIGDKVSDMARDAESKGEELITDAESKLEDSSDGKVEDSDGLIGNETQSSTDTNENGGMGKVGQIALIVLAVAAIIAVIVIITVVSRKKKEYGKNIHSHNG